MCVCVLSQALKKQLENVDAKINEVLRELQKIESERSHLRYIHTVLCIIGCINVCITTCA